MSKACVFKFTEFVIRSSRPPDDNVLSSLGGLEPRHYCRPSSPIYVTLTQVNSRIKDIIDLFIAVMAGH